MIPVRLMALRQVGEMTPTVGANYSRCVSCYIAVRYCRVNLGFVQHLHFQNFGAGGSQGSRNATAGTQGKRPAIQP